MTRISAHFAALANRARTPPPSAEALERTPRVVGQPVHTTYVRPLSPPVTLDWRIATRSTAGNPPAPTVPQFTVRPAVVESPSATAYTLMAPTLSAEEARAVEAADEWLNAVDLSGNPLAPEAEGDDRLRIAIEVAKKIRDFGVPEHAAIGRIELWNEYDCMPHLEPHELELVVRVAHGAESGAAPQGADDIRPPEPILDGEADLPANRERLSTEREAPTGGTGLLEAVPTRSYPAVDPPPAKVGRARSGAERMRRRRAALKQLGLSGESKGRLKALKVTATAEPAAEIVTAAIAPTAEIVTATDTPTTHAAEIVTPNAEVVQ
jgi:hypothetical protein